MNRGHISAVILAAGYSRRMHDFKPLLTIGGRTLLDRAVALFRAAGIADIRVVVGHGRERLRPILDREGIKGIINRRNSPEMFSSVLAALTHLEPAVTAVFFQPVDIPLVRPHTITQLLKRQGVEDDRILIPSFRGRRGHPVLIPSGFFGAIRRWDGSDGLRGAFAQLQDRTVSVAVADANILADMDTPEDYEALKQRCRRYHVPTRDECEVILTDLMRVDERLFDHCRAVAGVAEQIGDALARSGCAVDRDLLIAAGLLHDMARGQTRHDHEAAEMLTKMGYPEVAQVVAAHMDIDCSSETPVSNAEVIYLADKLVKGDEIVPLAQRFQEAMDKYGSDPEVKQKVKQRFHDALVINKKIQDIIGKAIPLTMHRY